jgi:Fic family protein
MPLTFQFKLSSQMKAVLQKADALNDFARWFGLTGMSFDLERRNADLGRLIHYLPAHLPAQNEQQIMAFVNSQAEEAGPDAQRILNIRKALQFCRVSEEPFGMPVLQKIHNILLNKLPESITGGMLRAEGGDGSLYPSASKMILYREDFTALANNKEIHPLIRAWLLYYTMMSVHFFDFENEALAIIFCYYFLQREGYGFKHLLRLEKFILHSKKYMAYSINYFEADKSYKNRLSQDLTSYLENCLQGFENNLAYIRDMFTASVKKRLEYSLLSPRLKNSVNFWLEQGYFHHRRSLTHLNPRQRDLLFRLYTGAELATADIAAIYNTDKKTIHDDMSVLLQAGVAVLKGGGKSSRFALNFDLRGK